MYAYVHMCAKMGCSTVSYSLSLSFSLFISFRYTVGPRTRKKKKYANKRRNKSYRK